MIDKGKCLSLCSIIERLLQVAIILIILTLLLVPVIIHSTLRQGGTGFASEPFDALNFTGVEINVTLNCSDDFYFSPEHGYCRPICSQWSFYKSRNAVLVLTGIASGLGLAPCILTFIVAGFRYKIILQFPTVFVLYATFMYTVRDVTLLVSSVANSQLFCDSDDDLLHSAYHSSIFCSISGIVNQYTSVSVTYWWFVWASVTFLKLVFPLRTRSLEKQGSCGYIHAAIVATGIFFPVIIILVTVLTYSPSYIITDSPPTVCETTNPDLTFYSTTFINIILTSIYSVMVIVTIRIIHKHNSGVFLNFSFSAVEKKLMFILILNILAGLVMYTTTAVQTALSSNIVNNAIEYFNCEAGGRERNCSHEIFDSIYGLLIVNRLTSSWLSLGPLLYVVNWKSVTGFMRIKDNTESKSRAETLEQ